MIWGIGATLCEQQDEHGQPLPLRLPVPLALPSGSDGQRAGFPGPTCQVTLLSMR